MYAHSMSTSRYRSTCRYKDLVFSLTLPSGSIQIWTTPTGPPKETTELNVIYIYFPLIYLLSVHQERVEEEIQGSSTPLFHPQAKTET